MDANHIPNEALSVYTFHRESPPLAPADSTRHYEREKRRRRLRDDGRADERTSPSLDEEDRGAKYARNEEDAESSGASDTDDAPPLDGSGLTLSQVGTPNFLPRADSAEVPLLAEDGPMPILQNIPAQAQDLQSYEFPAYRLKTLHDEHKTPLVLVACGSYSPCTYLHLRMFEMGRDAIVEKGRFEIVGGYYSPVGDAYGKRGLAAAHHRVRMCELAADEDPNGWLMVDAWESLQSEYTRTALVLDHFDKEINGKRGGILTASGARRRARIMLLAGGDLIQSFGEPGVWEERDLHHILGRYGCLVVERTGSDVWSFLLSHDILWRHRSNVIVVKQLIYNDISSTKVRLFVRRGMSIKYLLPDSLIHYIRWNRLYTSDEPMGKD